MKKLLTLFLLFTSVAWADDMARVDGGKYKPLFGKGKETSVGSFLIDRTAVTNANFILFVQKNQEWKKGKVPVLFADADYLKQWKTDTDVGDKSLLQSPVVYVSWFGAKAYCESQNKHLPTVQQWEYLAQFGPVNQAKDVNAVILEWYSKPTPAKLPHVKSTFKNQFGVWDVHGLIWEWTEDFNSAFVTGESRGDSALEKSMFCGSGAVGSTNPSDYAAFMRFGFRSSLKGNYTVGNLGFRCVKEK